MTTHAWILLGLYLALLLATVKPMGSYLADVMEGKAYWAQRLVGPVERLIYRLCGVHRDVEMHWLHYAIGLLLFNLLGEFQRASRLTRYRRPATLRAQVFLCGALLGRAGRRLVLHLSSAWGGLQQRNPLLENVLRYINPTSPKLNPEPT